MGFVKMGKRSFATNTTKKGRKRKLENEDSSTQDSDAKQQKLDDADTASAGLVVPEPIPGYCSSFERLPTEIIQRIYVESCTPALQLASRTLYSILSSPLMLKQMLDEIPAGLSPQYWEVKQINNLRRIFSSHLVNCKTLKSDVLQDLVCETKKLADWIFPFERLFLSSSPYNIPLILDMARYFEIPNRNPEVCIDLLSSRISPAAIEVAFCRAITQREYAVYSALNHIVFLHNGRLKPPHEPDHERRWLALLSNVFTNDGMLDRRGVDLVLVIKFYYNLQVHDSSVYDGHKKWYEWLRSTNPSPDLAMIRLMNLSTSPDKMIKVGENETVWRAAFARGGDVLQQMLEWGAPPASMLGQLSKLTQNQSHQ